MEDYLEMIYRLSGERGCTRTNEVADSLSVNPASVSKMVDKLAERSLVTAEKYGLIYLTEKGKNQGEYLLKRHDLLEEFFQLIGARGNLQKEVERIEHHISFENYQVLSQFVRFLKDHPECLSAFHNYANHSSHSS